MSSYSTYQHCAVSILAFSLDVSHDFSSELSSFVVKLHNDHHDMAVFMILCQLATVLHFPQIKV